jgi:hypothetical protein
MLKSQLKPCLSTALVANILSVKLLFFHTSQLRSLYENSEKFPGKTGKISLRTTDLSLLHIIQTGYKANQPLVQCILGTLSLGMKQLEHKADLSNPLGATARND